MFLDEKGDRSTLRIGWSEVVDNLDRGSYSILFAFSTLDSDFSLEAQARQAWLLTLTTDVIIPLTNLKVRTAGFDIMQITNEDSAGNSGTDS